MRDLKQQHGSWLAVTLLSLMLAGCTKQAQETAAAPPPDNGTALQPAEPPLPPPAEKESVQSTTKETKLPEDFPLPLYTGFQIKNTLRTQAGDFRGTQVELVGNAPLNAIAEFYEAEFRKRQLKVSKMNQKTGSGEELLMLGQSETVTAGVAATQEGNQTRIVLSWSEKQSSDSNASQPQ
ncbi:MAG: hypothetical protein CFK49_06480 [Armatimonadetes bacterium JP3_11]|jgi:hypothetical protein|nr:MAG: hypothetical protein CFK48_01170 [Armatimonadetes bacterium CP1_7O]OYT74818.1 MAG: hypothetical protein CFK49_06480 [Armatimonadetes bacterium JP3_11]RMH08630.1 MAG: hypothetical protein D6697_05675 [Armatimonadota bacterium]